MPAVRFTFARVLALGCVVVASAGPAFAQAPDTSQWVTDGYVSAMQRVGNTLFLGGSFARVGPYIGSAVPFDPVTAQPQQPFARISGYVSAVVADGAGGWFVGGSFVGTGGTQRRNLVHLLADGSVAPWSPDPDSEVLCLALSGNTLYVGGRFEHIGGQARYKIGAVDVSSGNATAFDAHMTQIAVNAWPYVVSVAAGPGAVYASGYFFTIGGQTRNYLAALDPATGNATGWSPAADGFAYAILPAGGTVYIGVNFLHVGGAARAQLAQLDAATAVATAWDPHPDGPVRTLALSGSTLYAGGAFTHVGATTRNSLAAFDTGAGLLTAFDANATGGQFFYSPVNAIALSGGTLYAAGTFTAMGGQPRRYLAAVDATTGAVGAWNPDVNRLALAMGATANSVFAGGQFWIAGGMPRSNLAAIDLATGHASSWVANADNQVDALVTDGTSLYAGGYFLNMQGVSRHYVAKLDVASAAVDGFNASPSDVVTCMSLDGLGKLYLGGYFLSVGGGGGHTLACVDAVTGNVLPFVPTTAGGPLNDVLADPAHNLVIGTGQGGMWAFNPSTSATVWTETFDPSGIGDRLQRIGSTLYLSGRFAQVQGQPRSNLAAVDVTTNTLLPWAPNAIGYSVEGLATDGSRIFAGGAFTSLGGQPRKGFAVIDAATGAVGPFDPALGGAFLSGQETAVFTVVAGGADLYLAGNFGSSEGFALPGAVRLAGPPPLPVPPHAIELGLQLLVAPMPAIENTALRFDMARAGCVWLDVLDLQGRRVAAIISGEVLAPGPVDRTLVTRGWKPGVYLARLRGDFGEVTRQIVVMQ